MEVVTEAAPLIQQGATLSEKKETQIKVHVETGKRDRSRLTNTK